MKKIGEYTDRELIERSALNSKVAADAASFVKTYIIVISLIGIVLFLIALIRLY